jgi:quinol monooxygenase YgiN
MITHVVLLQPKVTTTEEQLAVFFNHVGDLQKQIPGIISISAGKNRSPYASAYTHGIIMRFTDEAHLQAHHPHPAHVAVVEELDRLCEGSIDFDLADEGKYYGPKA